MKYTIHLSRGSRGSVDPCPRYHSTGTRDRCFSLSCCWLGRHLGDHRDRSSPVWLSSEKGQLVYIGCAKEKVQLHLPLTLAICGRFRPSDGQSKSNEHGVPHLTCLLRQREQSPLRLTQGDSMPKPVTTDPVSAPQHIATTSISSAESPARARKVHAPEQYAGWCGRQRSSPDGHAVHYEGTDRIPSARS